MIVFTLEPYRGRFGFDGRLRIDNAGPVARALEARLQTEIDRRRQAATGYHPSADVFARAALAPFGAVIVMQIDPAPPPAGAVE